MKQLSFISFVFLCILINGCKNDNSNCSPVGGYEIKVVESNLDDVAFKQVTVDCPKDKRALGAGWSVVDSTNAILDGSATFFQPSFDGKSWMVNAKNNSGFARNWKLRVSCICADVCPDKAFKEYQRPNEDSAK